MRILRDGVPTYYSSNDLFNKAAGPLVGEIFQTQDDRPIGYIMARTSRPAPNDWKPNPLVKLVKSAYEGSKEDQARFDFSGLGEYERVIFSCIAWGNYSTYVLTGEMGSGKTATTKLIQAAIRRRRSQLCGVCEKCDPIIISLDFNQGFRGKNTVDLVQRFQQKLADRLRQYLRQLFAANALTDALLEEFTGGIVNEDYASFDPFAQDSHEDIELWNNKSLKAKADALFKFVDQRAPAGQVRVEMLMALVKLTKLRLRADNACLVFFFDNIDSIWPEAQYEVLVEILSYMSIAGAKALVVLRRSNFHGLQNQAAYSFGCIEHIGPEVAQVIKRRIEYYLGNWNSIPKATVLDRTHQEALKKRLSYIRSTADDPHGALRVIANLAGGSVRQGLFASERLIINGSVPFDKDPHYKDDLKRAALFGSSNPGIALDDSCVANLFVNRMTGEASLLNIRILQLIAALHDDIPKRNVKTLHILLKEIGNWTGEEIRRALNYLLNMRRPLLWVDGKVEYESVAHMHHSDDFLYLTEAGHLYLRYLLRDLVYVQEGTLSVEWPSTWMPKNIDYSDLVGRFRILRGALRELMQQDLDQTKGFKAKVDNGVLNFGVPFLLITNRILASVGLATFRILGARAERGVGASSQSDMIEVVKDWLSLVNLGLDHEREISGMHRALDQLSRDYTRLLRVLTQSKKRT